MMIIGQVGKWEEFFAESSSLWRQNLQIVEGQTRIEKRSLKVLGLKNIPRISPSMQEEETCQIHQIEEQIEIHHIDIWLDKMDF